MSWWQNFTESIEQQLPSENDLRWYLYKLGDLRSTNKRLSIEYKNLLEKLPTKKKACGPIFIHMDETQAFSLSDFEEQIEYDQHIIALNQENLQKLKNSL